MAVFFRDHGSHDADYWDWLDSWDDAMGTPAI